MIDLHADLNALLKYVDRYRKYLPISRPSVQRRMQYTYDNKPLESSLNSDVQKQWDLPPPCNISL
ncbi:ADP-ribosylglycohydrolase family protein, partial [Enterobacter hormaechei]